MTGLRINEEILKMRFEEVSYYYIYLMSKYTKLIDRRHFVGPENAPDYTRLYRFS
jgi:hypothetical protein